MDAAIRQVFERGLGDARVQSVTWSDEDLVIDLILPGLSPRNFNLRFKAVSHLRIDLDYGGYVGEPLLFSAEAKKVESSGWKVIFQFGVAPDGKIEFECGEICEQGSKN